MLGMERYCVYRINQLCVLVPVALERKIPLMIRVDILDGHTPFDRPAREPGLVGEDSNTPVLLKIQAKLNFILFPLFLFKKKNSKTLPSSTARLDCPTSEQGSYWEQTVIDQRSVYDDYFQKRLHNRLP